MSENRRKPVPPDNLWEEMDKVVEERWGTRPEGSFTVTEFANKYKLVKGRAERRLSQLTEQGMVEKVKIGSRCYYSMVKK